MNTNEPDLVQQILALFSHLEDELRPLNPLHDGYLCLSMSAAGFTRSTNVNVRVFFDSGLTAEAASLAGLKALIADMDPKKVRENRIAALESELAELRQQDATPEQAPKAELALEAQ